MLKSAARAEEGRIPPASELDRVERALHAAIGSSRGGEQTVALRQTLRGRRVEQRRRRQPADFERRRELLCQLPERGVGCRVGAEIWIEVPDDSDVDCLAHQSDATSTVKRTLAPA